MMAMPSITPPTSDDDAHTNGKLDLVVLQKNNEKQFMKSNGEEIRQLVGRGKFGSVHRAGLEDTGHIALKTTYFNSAHLQSDPEQVSWCSHKSPNIPKSQNNAAV
jgi:hypothetical protein